MQRDVFRQPKGFFRQIKKVSRTAAENAMSSLGIGNELLNFAPNTTPWCNGNTAGFGPAIQGSSPCGVAWAAMPEPVGACSRVLTGFFCAPILLWPPVTACVLPPALPPESFGRHLWSSLWGIACLASLMVGRVAPSVQSSLVTCR